MNKRSTTHGLISLASNINATQNLQKDLLRPEEVGKQRNLLRKVSKRNAVWF